jgi:tetratricopeptide (TPR) repeat protein
LYQDVTLSSRSPDVASSVTRKVQCKTNLKVPEPNVLSKNPKLSICMIVKDEEKNLKRCLKSVRSIVNELIVVDTGSKDNSISVAKNFGAKVSRFTWCDDFSAARNEALKHATGDWIFQIDADEELLPNSIPFLRERMQDAWSLLYMITIDNGPAHSERFYKSGRLFRNHPHILYSRPYHETIRPSVDNLITSESGWRIVYEPKIVIRHYGYEKSQIDNKGKWNRELRILELYIKENPDDQSMAIRLAELYEHAERYDEALDICKRALAINPNYAAAHHIMGTAFYSMGRLDEAIVAFKKCLAIDPQLAWVHYHLGAAYCNKGNIDDAVVELKQAIVIDPDLGKAHISLGVIYHMKGMLNEAFDEYQQALKINPADAEAHFNLGIMYRNKGMLDEAIKEYKKALANDPLLAEAHNNIAITYYLKKEYRKAVKHCDKAIALGFKVHPKFLQDLEPYRK